MDKTSPEERLLRLIRKDTKKPSAKEEGPVSAFHPQRLLHFKKQAKRKTGQGFSFTLINRLLLIALFILGIYLLLNFLIVTPNKIEEKVLLLEFEEAKDAKLDLPPSTAKEEALPPLSNYTQAIKSRNLFTAKAATTTDMPSVDFKEVAAKLRLQGIIAGEAPQAIIEDTKTGQIYFLTPGDRINEIEVKEISSGKVILNYHGQEAELAL